eukprot:5353224-Alexandrium_andersonii.AAC.1
MVELLSHKPAPHLVAAVADGPDAVDDVPAVGLLYLPAPVGAELRQEVDLPVDAVKRQLVVAYGGTPRVLHGCWDIVGAHETGDLAASALLAGQGGVSD